MAKISHANINDLSPEQASSLGSTVGGLLNDGMPVSEAVDATNTLARFIRNGVAAQNAVDQIIAATLKQKS